MALIAFWKLNDDTDNSILLATVGQNIALDVLFAEEDIPTTSEATTDGPGGQITKAIYFNGSFYGNIYNYQDIVFTNGQEFSVSFWGKSLSDPTYWLAREDVSTGAIRKSSNTIIIIDNTLYTTPSIGITNWHHYLITKDTSNICRVFVDGVESVSGSQTESSTISIETIAMRNESLSELQMAWLKIFDSDESSNVASLYDEINQSIVHNDGIDDNYWHYSKNTSNYLQVNNVNNWAPTRTPWLP